MVIEQLDCYHAGAQRYFLLTTKNLCLTEPKALICVEKLSFSGSSHHPKTEPLRHPDHGPHPQCGPLSWQCAVLTGLPGYLRRICAMAQHQSTRSNTRIIDRPTWLICGTPMCL